MSERRAFSVAVFARRAGRVLLIEHKRLRSWLPVGGELEPGETPLEAAVRELREETGLSGRFQPLADVDGTPAGLLGYEEHRAGDKGLHMNFVFVADVERDEVVANGEFDAYQWVTSSEHLDAPLNVHQLVRLCLRPQPSELVALAHAWLAAWSARDLDKLISLYEPDAVHVSPKLRARDPATHGEVRGTAALRAWWQDSLDRLPGLRYAVRTITAMDDRVFMHYVRSNPGDEDLHVAELLVVSLRGRVSASHVFHG